MTLFLPSLAILTWSSANKQSFQKPTKRPFCPMLHRCKNVQLALKCHCTFNIYGPLGRKAFCQNFKRCFISWITSLNVQKLQFFVIFASFLASTVNRVLSSELLFVSGVFFWNYFKKLAVIDLSILSSFWEYKIYSRVKDFEFQSMKQIGRFCV